MPTFGTKSKSYLVQCHPALQKVLKEAIKNVDFSIICATRGRAAQEEAFRWGGDFNMDGDKTTSDAWDAGHVEIHPWRDWAKR
jgi:hypothetical protein